MAPDGTDTWILPEGLRPDRLLAALAGSFGFHTFPEYAAEVVYADSFDWRLFQRGHLIHCHDRGWTLYHGDAGEVTVQQDGPELGVRCFARDFPPGPLRDLLTPLLGVRALLPMARVHLVGRQVRLLNRDEKTVARLVFERQRPAASHQTFSLVRLFGLRGYDEELATVRRLLRENGVTHPASPLAGFREGCRVAGHMPLDYTSKFAVRLDVDCTAREAMVHIYRQLLVTISRNLPGTIDDLDPEFLHDLRVAIRRTRSGLSLVKEVLPAEMVDTARRDFATLGAITGPTRDLDVYLEQRESYLERLPEVLRPGLNGFFADLAVRRRTEQQRLARGLRGKKTRAILAAWKRQLNAKTPQPAPRAEVPVIDLAGRIIHRRSKRVLRDGRALHSATPDAEVHRLRIQCKKLRYALEFFGSLYPEDDMALLVRQLKRLQDILGDFNDLSVQQQLLAATLTGLRKGARVDLGLAAALGGLMQSLYQEQQALRDHFSEAFARFADPETTDLYRTLFRPREEPA